jgi:hypothetical protein
MKNKSIPKPRIDQKLIKKALPEDWAQVRAQLGLSRDVIFNNKSGRSSKHVFEIESALVKIIATRIRKEKRLIQQKNSLLNFSTHNHE